MGIDVYVAPGGSDAGPGTEARPFATLEGARDAVRRLKATRLPEGGVTVWLDGGDYLRACSFTLGPEDSGAAAAPITYRAKPGETVRLLGGKPVSGFTPVEDPAVLARLDPAARGQVLQADLKALGIADFGALSRRGFGQRSTPAHLELFFRGEAMTLARWPNAGFTHIAGIPEGARADDGHGEVLGELQAGFLYDGDHPSRWQRADDIWVHGYWAWDWANSYEQVESIDLQTGRVRTRAPHGLYGFRAGQRFYFLNILEELDSPGEYYVDRQTGLLYFWPPGPLAEGELYASVLAAPLIEVNGASHVAMRGLTLQYARGHGISVTGGAGVTVTDCTLRNIGNWAAIIKGSAGHAVTGCDIEHIGDGGIKLIGGDRKTLAPGGHRAENNHIHHFGEWSRCYRPGVMVIGVGNLVAHNLIHDGPHNAIQISGNEHVIELNEIHHVCLETGDVGAFYMGRDWTMRGNIVRCNFFHHLGGVGMGSMAVYLDDCASGTTVFGNIFYKATRAAFIGGGRDNAVENNIFVDCEPAVFVDGRGLDASPVWHDMVYVTMKNRLEEVSHHQPPYGVRYPALMELDRYYQGDAGVPPEGNVIARNICAGGRWMDITWHADARYLDIRDNLVDADPGFANPAQMDFRLRDDSPAWALGFQRIPVEEIGLRRLRAAASAR